MTASLRLLVLMCLGVAAILSAMPASAAQGRSIMTGNDQTVWLLVPSRDAGRFDVLARPSGGEWDWISHSIGGDVTAAAASGSNLCVMLRGPLSFGTFSPGKEKEQDIGPQAMTILLTPRHPKWPSDAPALAMVEAVGLGQTPAASLVAIVACGAPAAPGAAATGPTTQPAAQGQSLAAFQKVQDKWVWLGEKAIDWRDGDRVFAAAHGGSIYVLVSGATNRLFIMGGRDLSLGKWTRAKALGLLNVSDRVVAVLAVPSARESYGLRLMTLGDGPEASTLDITAGAGQPFTWKSDQLPLVARMGESIELVWRQEAKLMWSRCNVTTGDMTAPSEMKVYTQGIQGQGLAVYRWFMIGVSALAFITYVTRPRTLPKPFALPPEIVPGNLFKRVLAASIDIFPFFMLARLVFPTSDVTPQEIWRLLQEDMRAPDEAYYMSILAASSFMIYCIVMEYLAGATVGKMLMRLRVTGDDNARPDMISIAMRNLMKIFELFWPIMLPFLLFFPVFTRNRQRIGDMLARTAVVETRRLPTPQNLTAEDAKSEEKDRK